MVVVIPFLTSLSVSSSINLTKNQPSFRIKYQLVWVMSPYIEYAREQWKIIHTLAKEANDRKSHKKFVDHILYIARNYICSTCREHIRYYISKKGIPIWTGNNTAFRWSVIFHNRVNRRLYKKQMTIEDAYQLY